MEITNYSFEEKYFGEYKTLILRHNKSGSEAQIAFKGAILLKFMAASGTKLTNVIDGFATPEEFKAAKGARCWIMAPFANRIPQGKYLFEGIEYQLEPIPPRDQVIHGFAAYQNFTLSKVRNESDFIEAIFVTKNIRPGVFKGYPFALDVYVSYKLEKNKLSVKITGSNVGDNVLPFSPGWHPYFKTSDEGIENLILTIDAENIIIMNDALIPLDGEEAYAKIEDFPQYNFASNKDEKSRIINSRILDFCYAGLKRKHDGYYRASIFNPSTGLKINVFQKEGFFLIFSGDSLPSRKRESIALEPMRFLTNAFNRKEFSEDIKIHPGESSTFEFGFEIENK